MNLSSDVHLVLLLPHLDPIGLVTLVPVIITTFEFGLAIYYYCGNLCDPTISYLLGLAPQFSCTLGYAYPTMGGPRNRYGSQQWSLLIIWSIPHS